MSHQRLLVAISLTAAGGCQLADENLGQESASVTAPAIDLVAHGSISGTRADLSRATAGTLENGVAGNLLGGLGSGLAYAGGNIFLAVPDRGPNAVPFNSDIDDTVKYINRFQTFIMDLDRSPAGSALPLTLSPFLIDTTLLRSITPLTYGTATADTPDGPPALNTRFSQFFTGRSDGFNPATLSTDPSDARFDPESIRVSADGLHVFISDEYGPHIYEFDRLTGVRVRSFTLPAGYAVPLQSPQGNTEIADNTVGRVANKGMEGLAISPDGKTLFGAMQSPLIQDGGTNAQFTRIIMIDVATGKTKQFAYPLTNIGKPTKPKFPTISDVLAVNDHELLFDERDGNGLGDDSVAAFKQIFHVDLTGAQDITGLSGEAALAPAAVAKTQLLDIVSVLTAHGIAAQDIPAKLEGTAFGPDVFLDGTLQHTLWVANDNDFLGTVTDTHHPAGIDNPNQFFVFAIDPSLLPGFQQQRILF